MNFQDIKLQDTKNEWALEELQKTGVNASFDQVRGAFSQSNEIKAEEESVDELVSEFSLKIEKVKTFSDQHISEDKPFADIALGGPKNMAEVALLEAACSLLSPDELQDAIVSKKSVADVKNSIDKSQTKKRVEQLILERQTELQQRQKDKESMLKEAGTVWQDKMSDQISEKEQGVVLDARNKNGPNRGI